jgi:Flp pilus assembly pilin Flp
MLGRLLHPLRRLFNDERAQSTVEYALVVSVTVALLVGISTVVLNGLAAYYRSITWIVCLPIP